uniref:Kinesin family member 15 n=1 Tax=Cynoglossus semilaevis TaxID=244447 RepID=A0A3P8UFV5_CYNSE
SVDYGKGFSHDSIKVFVRVRPLTQGTGLTTDGDQGLCLKVTSPNTIRLLAKPEPRTFTYDYVADMDTTQDSVFSSVAKNIVAFLTLTGKICYCTSTVGQTGSGKTFTMLGPSELDNFTDELRGVIPRSFEYLFFLINREIERSPHSKSFLCKCSFIEIYNEQIYDLLDTASASLFLRENIKKGVFVEGAVEKFVTSAAEAYQVLSMGWRNRRVASTSMNRESSRSHAVFTMTLESKESINEVVNIRMSQLNLVDLAGSERQKDTHTEGSRLKEASSINRSLMCLGQVIMALVDVSNGKNRHICYRDSKLTFLLRDSLGGNAKTFIIANVHPGSKCFGETLSTLQFAQRAKLIKNKAVINEDTQGNVRQLQAEVKKLKEQLALVLASQNQLDLSYKTKFISAIRLWRKRGEEKKILLQKVAQLEEAWKQKDKFIHSSRMIVRFREEHISRLEAKLKAGQNLVSNDNNNESQALMEQLKDENKILRDQVEHHPKMTRYAAENFSLRQENRHLRSLESVVKAEDVLAEVAAELEEAFKEAMESESQGASLSSGSAESVSMAAVEKLKAQLLQKQSDLTGALQAFEEYKEITNKQISQLESEKRYLEKSNKHLENILEATNTYKKQEVSELNRIHVETIKILTTPTKAYHLRSRLIPLSSPEHLNDAEAQEDDIWEEQPPSDMTEVALTEELRQVQEQSSRVQSQLNDEEIKNSKLLQQIAKLEEQMQLSTEKTNRNRDQLKLQQTIDELQQSLESEKQNSDVLRSEIRDLRLVLQSSDKELEALKNKMKEAEDKQEEMSQLSNSLNVQLDNVRLEWEQLLEQHRMLQDSFDQIQAETKFEADQSRQQLQNREQEIEQLKAQLMVRIFTLNNVYIFIQNYKLSSFFCFFFFFLIQEANNSLQNEHEHTSSLMSQLENKEMLQDEVAYATEEVERLTKVLDEQNCLLRASQEQNEEIQRLKVMCSFFIFNYNRLKVRALAGLITCFGADRKPSKKLNSCVILSPQTQLTEKEMVRMEIQALLDKFYTKQNSEELNDAIKDTILNELQEECLSSLCDLFFFLHRLQTQESMLAQSQTCVQELTTELRNRCLELRDLTQRVQDEEKLLHENDVLRKQNVKLSEENGKLVGHKNLKQRIEYLVKLKKENTRLQETCRTGGSECFFLEQGPLN